MFYVGIDPGVKGAIAIISKTEGVITVEAIHDMPTTTKTLASGANRSRVDALALHSLMALYPDIRDVCIEDVGPRPTDGVIAAFTFGHSLTCAEMCARLTGAEVRLKAPKKWKSSFGLTSVKNESRHLAQVLTGDAVTFKRVRDDGRAEAALLAVYAAAGGDVQHQGAVLDAFRLEQAAKPSKKVKTGAEILADLKARVANL